MKKIVKNKKLLLLIIIPIVIIITASIIILINNNKKEPNNEIINIINKNSNLPIKYMSKYKENNKYFKKCEVIKNFMSHDYKNKDIVFSFYGYPTDESDYYLGRYTLLTSKYNLLGVKVGDGIKESINKIKKHDFKLEEETEFNSTLSYEDFTIELEQEEEKPIIKQITIAVKNKYTGERIY